MCACVLIIYLFGRGDEIRVGDGSENARIVKRAELRTRGFIPGTVQMSKIYRATLADFFRSLRRSFLTVEISLTSQKTPYSTCTLSKFSKFLLEFLYLTHSIGRSRRLTHPFWTIINIEKFPSKEKAKKNSRQRKKKFLFTFRYWHYVIEEF